MSNQEDNLESLHIHIAGLQAVLTKRNESIKRLETKIAELESNEITESAKNKSYRQGYRDCAVEVSDSLRAIVMVLRKFDGTLLELYRAKDEQ